MSKKGTIIDTVASVRHWTMEGTIVSRQMSHIQMAQVFISGKNYIILCQQC